MNIHALRTSERALDALDLARRIEARRLTPAAVLESCEQAIAAREADIGAFTALDLPRARKSAAVAPAGPLRGLPVGVKDIFDTTDFPTEYGSSIYAGHRPVTDAAIVSQIRRAGGFLLGKTVTTEFAHMQPGKTRNPINREHTPGGSSSGSAAAVAAGMVPIAIGSQTGGSVIRPAAFCGVAGFKPSYQLLPTVGMKCFSWQLDTVGVFAARVSDVAFAAAAIADRDLRVDDATPAAPRIALMRMHIWSEASEAMQAALEAAARAAAAAGARVEDMALPAALEDAWRAHPTIQDYEAYRALAFEYDHHRDRIAPALRKLLDDAAEITAERYDEAPLEKQRGFQRALVAPEPPDDLHPERQAGIVGEARHVHARRAHQGPQPIEDRIAGRLQAARRRARRRRREDDIDVVEEIAEQLARAARGAPCARSSARTADRGNLTASGVARLLKPFNAIA
jgi:Asp-tRNA(Asn)/Glu-tRNA(Gln) amidotransferase A subunit family amidase